MKLHDLRLSGQLEKDKRSLVETAITSYLGIAGLRTRYDFDNQEVTVFLGQKEQQSREKVSRIVGHLRDAGYSVSEPKDGKIDGAAVLMFSVVEEEPVTTGQEGVRPEQFDKSSGTIPGGRNYSAAATESRRLTLEASSWELDAAERDRVDTLLKQVDAALEAGDGDEASRLLDQVDALIRSPKAEDGTVAAGSEDDSQSDSGNGIDDQSVGAPSGMPEVEEAHVTWMDGKVERVGRVVAYKESADVAQVEVTTKVGENIEIKRIMVHADRLSLIESGEKFKVGLNKRRQRFNLLYSN